MIISKGYFMSRIVCILKRTLSGGRTYHVNLREHGCTCGKLLIYGFPCSHILTVYKAHSIDF